MAFRGHLDSRPHTLYRCWSASGELLYIGCSRDVKRRLYAHRRKPWWPEVASVTTEDYEDGFGGFWAEKAAIQAEQPRHNVMLKDSRRDWQPCGAMAERKRIVREAS